MNRYFDVPCPTLTPAEGEIAPGTRWLHNRQVKKWYMVKACPVCRQVHLPTDIRADRLVIPPAAVAA